MKIFLLLLLFVCPKIIYAQLQMDITEMYLSKLKTGSNQKEITNGRDTTILIRSSTSEYDSPYINVRIRIKNVSDSTFVIYPLNPSGIGYYLYPDESSLYISYSYKGKVLKIGMHYIIDTYNDSYFPVEKIILAPSQEFFIESGGYIAKNPNLRLGINNADDRTTEVMRILPTLKYHFKVNDSCEIIHQNVENVTILKRPPGDELSIPEGYYQVE